MTEEATPFEILSEAIRSDEFSNLANLMASLRQPFFDDARLFAHIDALAKVMPALQKAVSDREIALSQVEPGEPVDVTPKQPEV